MNYDEAETEGGERNERLDSVTRPDTMSMLIGPDALGKPLSVRMAERKLKRRNRDDVEERADVERRVGRQMRNVVDRNSNNNGSGFIYNDFNNVGRHVELTNRNIVGVAESSFNDNNIIGDARSVAAYNIIGVAESIATLKNCNHNRLGVARTRSVIHEAGTVNAYNIIGVAESIAAFNNFNHNIIGVAESIAAYNALRLEAAAAATSPSEFGFSGGIRFKHDNKMNAEEINFNRSNVAGNSSDFSRRTSFAHNNFNRVNTMDVEGMSLHHTNAPVPPSHPSRAAHFDGGISVAENSCNNAKRTDAGEICFNHANSSDASSNPHPRLLRGHKDLIVVKVIKSPIGEQEEIAATETGQVTVGDYFPLLQDDLGIQCLTRIPRSKIYEAAVVCKSWKNYLLRSEMYRARRALCMREDWVFILGMNLDKKWRAFRPSINDWIVIPPCPTDYTFDSCDKESTVAGLSLLVMGQCASGFKIWRFDTIKSQWFDAPRMHSDRCLFGSASSDHFAYFGGGSCRGAVLKSAERYNSETDSWELLPDMHTERKCCSGFFMDGKFHVIGGHSHDNIVLNSGEVYDPKTGLWTVIPGMWPRRFSPNSRIAPPLVAVLDNKLYGYNIVKNALMLYDKERSEWHLLQKVPQRAKSMNGWGLGFKAVGDELFIIGGARGPGQFFPAIHAYRPAVSNASERWRFVTYLRLPTSGFIYNCAVMSG